MNSKGNSFANGPNTGTGNSCNNGNTGSDPTWQRRLYGWLADPNSWTFTEP